MRVVIAGLGSVGTELAAQLVRREHFEVVLIDADRARCEQASDSLDALVIHGDATDPEMLLKAQIGRADALIATTESDALNTVVAMLGRHFDVGITVVKLKSLSLRAACQSIGVTRIIAPSISAAAEIHAALTGAHGLDFSVVAHGGLRLVEVEVSGVKVDGKALSDIRFPDGALVVGIFRGEDVILPRGPTRLAHGDVLLTLVESEAALAEVRSHAGL